MDRRTFLAACLAPVAGCGRPGGPPPAAPPSPAEALRRGVEFLLRQQVESGAFVSDGYAPPSATAPP